MTLISPAKSSTWSVGSVQSKDAMLNIMDTSATTALNQGKQLGSKFEGTPLTIGPSQSPPTGEKTAFEPPLLPSEPQVSFLLAKDCMPVALTDFENGANITPPELPRSCERHGTDCAPHLEYLRRMWTAAYIPISNLGGGRPSQLWGTRKIGPTPHKDGHKSPQSLRGSIIRG